MGATLEHELLKNETRPAAAKGAISDQERLLQGRVTTPAVSRAVGANAAPDTSPLMSRRGWIALAWGAFSAATAASLAATGRFMFPNVLNEPPQRFAAGLPDEFAPGVDERFKRSNGVWIVRTNEDLVQGDAGLYTLIAVCTHLGCTPNYLAAEHKFKCPCHGSGFRETGINFEGPAPRPLERAAVSLADDGQVVVDKGRRLLFERGQWIDAEALLKV